MSGAVNTYWTNDPDVGLAGDLVAARFGMSTDLVNQYSNQSSSAIDALAGYSFLVPLDNLDLESLTAVEHPNIGDAPAPDAVAPYISQMQDVTFSDLEALRASLELVEVTLEQVTLPVLSALEPTVNLPDAPDDILPDVPGDVPAASEVTIPTSPTIDLPAVPVLEEIALPAVPVIENVTFDAVLPTADLTAPEPMFIYDEATYQSDLADALKTKLYNDVTLGGTGLDADVEQAIWDRALSRLNIELDKTNQQVLTNWEAWNQEMPDGLPKPIPILLLRVGWFTRNRSWTLPTRLTKELSKSPSSESKLSLTHSMLRYFPSTLRWKGIEYRLKSSRPAFAQRLQL
jgi:hypothetical protein